MEDMSAKSSKRVWLAAALLGVGAAAAVGVAASLMGSGGGGELAARAGPRLGLGGPESGQRVDLVPSASEGGSGELPGSTARLRSASAPHGPEQARLLSGADEPANGAVADTAARDPGASPKEQAPARAVGPKKTSRDGRIASTEAPRGLRSKAAVPAPEVAHVGSTVRVTTTAHTAEFDPQGLVFTPHDRRGVRVPASRFAYRLEAVRRGEHVLWSGGDCAPVASGQQVRYERAPGLVEHYSLALDRGVEQLFSLPEVPAGAGDLIFTASVETDLQGRQDARGGLHFQAEPGAPGVVFGRAVVYDGLGRSTAAELTLAGATLELRVPGDWLDAASGPLLVDPLIGSDQQLTAFTGDDDYVDIAYSPLDGQFMIVYVNSGTNLAASRLDGEGNVLQAGVLIDSDTTDAKSRPAIAWSAPSVNNYMVAYRRAGAVYVVVFDNTLTVVSAAARLFNPVGGADQNNPALAFDPGRGSWFVVWDDNSQSASRDILGERVLGDGTQQGTVVVRNLTAALADPAASYSATSDRFLVTFSSGSDVAGAVINGAVTSIVATPTISSLTGTQDKSRAAWNSADDEWAVVFESDHLGDDDIFLRRVSTGGTLLGSLVSVAISVEDEQVLRCTPKARGRCTGPGMSGAMARAA